MLLLATLFRVGWYIVFREVDENAITPVQATEMLDNGALLVDVRQLEEFEEAHVAGARLIPLGELSDRLSELQAYRDRPVIVVCRTGGRSAIGSLILMNAGFTRVHNLEGGMMAWKQAGLSVER